MFIDNIVRILLPNILTMFLAGSFIFVPRMFSQKIG